VGVGWPQRRSNSLRTFTIARRSRVLAVRHAARGYEPLPNRIRWISESSSSLNRTTCALTRYVRCSRSVLRVVGVGFGIRNALIAATVVLRGWEVHQSSLRIAERLQRPELNAAGADGRACGAGGGAAAAAATAATPTTGRTRGRSECACSGKRDLHLSPGTRDFRPVKSRGRQCQTFASGALRHAALNVGRVADGPPPRWQPYLDRCAP
jgi:hypothetical protein